MFFKAPLILILSCVAGDAAFASSPPARPQIVLATAKKNGGAIAYTERHEILVSSTGKPIEARTEYLGPDQKLKAILSTNFRDELAASDYTFVDERDGTSHGVEVSEEGYRVWRKSKSGARQDKLIRRDVFRPGELVVAGQGLHFYLRDNLQKAVPTGETLSVKLLVPGHLDYFSFGLSVESEDERRITFRMRVKSVFLRLFASSLRFTYDKASRELIHYSGPSNLADDGGGLQNVEIKYDIGMKPGVDE